MSELDELRMMYYQRDLVLVVLFMVLVAVALAASSVMARCERIVERHCRDRWSQWVEEDRRLQNEKLARKMRTCPRGHGTLVKGVCDRCGFK